MAKTLIIALVIFSVLFLIYLLLPQPVYPPPLPDSVKSTEEGDTVQIPGVTAYFSQHDRKYVTGYYQQKFDQIAGFPFNFFSYRLNHPPQYSHEKIRAELQSSYFEEVVHPFRESLFVNGWEPETFYRGNPGNISRYEMIVNGQKYFSKTTLRPFYSSIPSRLINYVGIIFSLSVLYFLTKRIIFNKN